MTDNYMTMDEMAEKVGPVRLALMAARAHAQAASENRSPGVDQGGQYVWSSPHWILNQMLEEAMKERPHE